jgi:hypothetical protein
MLQSMGQNISDKAKAAWRELYQAALAEVDSGEVRRKIDLACTAILQRINALAEARDLWAVEEQREILESLNNLRRIQQPGFQPSEDANQLTPGSAERNRL